jgi:hypothetical protein
MNVLRMTEAREIDSKDLPSLPRTHQRLALRIVTKCDAKLEALQLQSG